MSLPTLENWDPTLSGLHQCARLLGVIQQLTQEPQPAYLELALQVDSLGVTTGKLPLGGRVLLDLLSASLAHEVPGQAPVSFAINGRTQAEIFTGLFTHLANGELGQALPPGEDLFERLAAGIAGRGNRYKPPQRKLLMDGGQLEVDPQISRAVLQALQAVFTGIARFKARRIGLQTPLVVWPHGFDLSTLWFAGTEIDESQFHMNFGFSPRSEGLDYPYLYAYAYPYPGGETAPALPAGARWHTQGWKGMLLPYEVIAAQADPQGFVETACDLIFNEFLSLKSA